MRMMMMMASRFFKIKINWIFHLILLINWFFLAMSITTTSTTNTNTNANTNTNTNTMVMITANFNSNNYDPTGRGGRTLRPTPFITTEQQQYQYQQQQQQLQTNNNRQQSPTTVILSSIYPSRSSMIADTSPLLSSASSSSSSSSFSSTLSSPPPTTTLIRSSSNDNRVITAWNPYTVTTSSSKPSSSSSSSEITPLVVAVSGSSEPILFDSSKLSSSSSPSSLSSLDSTISSSSASSRYLAPLVAAITSSKPRPFASKPTKPNKVNKKPTNSNNNNNVNKPKPISSIPTASSSSSASSASSNSSSSSSTTTTSSTASKISIRFNKYHNYDEMTHLLKLIAKRKSNIAKLYSIGQSVKGRELWVMHLTNFSTDQYEPIKPNVKYIANMHGNEAVGREMMLRLIAYLVNFSHKSTNVKRLLNTTNIHIMPSMNPDGFEESIEGRCEGPGRKNANGIDLNRNFPDRIFNITDREQPETYAIRKWMNNTQFVLSVNIHGGALVVNYPFDSSAVLDSEHLEKTPDHDVFLHLAMTYAKRHPKLKSQYQCRKDEKFENGITNGNAWYPVQGSMQDYNYIYAGCMELTLEISCCKYPNATNLLNFWTENKSSLLALLNEANKGVKGILKDYYTEIPIPKANITILGRSIKFQSDLNGKFWRILLPGDYVLIVTSPGYITLQKQFTIVTNKLTMLELFLMPSKRLNRRFETLGWKKPSSSSFESSSELSFVTPKTNDLFNNKNNEQNWTPFRSEKLVYNNNNNNNNNLNDYYKNQYIGSDYQFIIIINLLMISIITIFSWPMY